VNVSSGFNCFINILSFDFRRFNTNLRLLTFF